MSGFAFGVDLAPDGSETLAQAERVADGTVHYTIVRLDDEGDQ
ncbi:MAG: hypothetical protein JWP85_2116 [Rhodoglobus sp.]|nr:hypothetical protein [Rhodoglobus sp.]